MDQGEVVPPPPQIWREPLRIRFDEIDANGRIQVPALSRYLQRAGDAHAGSVGASLAELRRQGGQTWILSHLMLRLDADPARPDSLNLESWISAVTSGMIARRNFRLFDADGTGFAAGMALYLVLDEATRRPVRLPDAVIALRVTGRPEAIPEAALRLPPPAPGLVDSERRFRVRWHEVDSNRHANNACYVEWALETAGAAMLQGRRLESLEIRYLREATYGDGVLSQAEIMAQDDRCRIAVRHRLSDGAGRDLALAQTVWGPL